MKPTLTQQEQEEAKKIAEAPKSDTDTHVASLLSKLAKQGKEKGFGMSVGNICRCICCPKPAPSEENAKFEILLHKLENVEGQVVQLQQEIRNETPARQAPEPPPKVTMRSKSKDNTRSQARVSFGAQISVSDGKTIT